MSGKTPVNNKMILNNINYKTNHESMKLSLNNFRFNKSTVTMNINKQRLKSTYTYILICDIIVIVM